MQTPIVSPFTYNPDIFCTLASMPHETASEQRAIDWAKIIETALTAPGNIGNTYNRFYEYSFLNQMYLHMQGVHEPVATWARWKAMGRHIIRGAEAKYVIRPKFAKTGRQRAQDRSEEADAIIEDVPTLIGFEPVKSIFALSDTAGEEPLPVTLPDWDFVTALQQLDIHLVPFTTVSGNLQGYSHGHDVAINPIAVNPPKTRFHEIGHVVLGHTSPEGLAEYQQHRGIMEFQAEATAYLTMNELGRLDDETAARSRGYVQTWLQGERPPDKAIREVFAATDQILRAGRLAIDAMIDGDGS
jgi:hypothetical protein